MNFSRLMFTFSELCVCVFWVLLELSVPLSFSHLMLLLYRVYQLHRLSLKLRRYFYELVQ